MPTVMVERADLFERLGLSPATFSDKAFDELCFEFGIELDEVMSEDAAVEKRQLGGGGQGGSAAAAAPAAEPRILYYIAIPANRYDLLCVEGIARALNVFLGRVAPPAYRVLCDGGRAPLVLTVAPETARVRPYVVAAVLRGVRLDARRYASFIELQDKLHVNICRRRTLVAIGTHDLDTLQPPFRYEARAPADIEFVPLSQGSRSFRADALMDFYSTDPSVKHIKPYVEIISGSPVFPVIYDSARRVLSLPPIINGEHSKLTLATRNIFVECTATDLTKAHVVLNTVVAMFAEYCEAPEAFCVEPVEVVYEQPVRSGMGGGDKLVERYLTPDLAPRVATVSHSETVSLIGVSAAQMPPESAAALCTRMGLQASVLPAGAPAPADAVIHASRHHGAGDTLLRVLVPPTRADVLHECDVIEDLAIAYGYNKLVRTLPRTATTGEQLPVNKLTDHLRRELARMGYDETLTLALCARDENFAAMRLVDDGRQAVVLSNPQSEEFQVGRTSMLPGLLKSLNSNRSARIADGLRLFEVSDVMLLDAASDVGARNERRLAALYSGATAGFEVVHGLVDRIMQLLEVPVRPYKWESEPAAGAGAGSATAAAAAAAGGTFGRGGKRYFVEAATAASTPTLASYFPGRVAQIVLESEGPGGAADVAGRRREVIGVFGVLHPEVLKAFDLGFPVSVLEMNVEKFL